MTVETRIVAARGCGFRKAGGLYLVAGGLAAPCGKFPIQLTVCPCCGQGIKFARGWTWVDADALIGPAPCCATAARCAGCPAASRRMGRAGLLWIGEQFYKTTDDFDAEAAAQGVSRRIKAVPHGFKLGQTWVLLAHVRALPWHPEAAAGIFRAFLPSAVEYVVTGKETEAELAALAEREITPVRDIPPQAEFADMDRGAAA